MICWSARVLLHPDDEERAGIFRSTAKGWVADFSRTDARTRTRTDTRAEHATESAGFAPFFRATKRVQEEETTPQPTAAEEPETAAPQTLEPTEPEAPETDAPVVATPEPTEEVAVTPAPQSPTPEPTAEPTEPLTPPPTIRWTFAPADPWTESPGAPWIPEAYPAVRIPRNGLTLLRVFCRVKVPETIGRTRLVCSSLSLRCSVCRLSSLLLCWLSPTGQSSQNCVVHAQKQHALSGEPIEAAIPYPPSSSCLVLLLMCHP